MDIREYNRGAWDHLVATGNRWTIPVTQEDIERARRGDWEIVLTPSKPVPREWFGELGDAKVLCLAGAGGQQAPILAAAGADVTVFDNSPSQLNQDRTVAEREQLSLELIEGDMRDLSCFEDERFDLIFHPCSNSFVPELSPVWQEAARVLRPGGHMLSGMCNPVIFLFDEPELAKGRLIIRHSIPYSDLTDLNEKERQELIDDGQPLCFGHSIEDQIAGQTDAGLAIVGFFEDTWTDESDQAIIARHLPGFFATRSRKLAGT
ncbi:MAG: class I SAM-dependent methyltransferase [Planctomycetota bacterium]